MVLIDKKKLRKKQFELVDRSLSKQYILLLLKGKAIEGKTKLMKELFFISKNIAELEKELEFEADNYGPSSEVITKYCEDLSNEGFIKLNKKGSKNIYKIDKLGNDYLKQSKSNLDLDLVDDIKELFDGLTYNETLALTYFTFPEITNGSSVKSKIMDKRVELALNLYKKDKISLEKASEIAGLSYKKFLELIQENNIVVELIY